jgi:hypothetical protein
LGVGLGDRGAAADVDAEVVERVVVQRLAVVDEDDEVGVQRVVCEGDVAV